jgi:hypothetical protein
MKRLLLAAAVLLGPAVGLASADYVMIKLDVNKILALPMGPSQGPTRTGQPAPTASPPPGTPGFAQPKKKQPQEQPLWATAYLQLKQKPGEYRDRARNVEYFIIDHPWGKALVPKELKDLGTIRFYHQLSAAERFVARKKELEREGKTPEKLLLLAQWALEHGLTSQFVQTMDELGKADAKNAAYLAFDKVRTAMAKPVSNLDPGAAPVVEELTRENLRTVASDSGHYTILTDIRPGGQNDVDLRKWEERLEDHYRNFFYWFAARGKVLAVPPYRLVAVVIAGATDFDRKHELYSPGPLVAPGFLVHRPNVAVYSAEPTGGPYADAYRKLEKYNKDEWQMVQVGRDELLTGAIVKQRPEWANNQMFIAKLQTLALLQKAIEKESARAAVTHEGTLQLVAATGLLPRGVVAGEWAHSGLAGFFETPFRAFYFGVGLPHWTYLVEFKHLKRSGPLAKSDVVLLKTISDGYFVTATSIQQQIELNKDEREALQPQLEDELLTARTSAWALTYYLAKHRLDGLEKYFQELAGLPRDLEFDETVLQGCFGRAFGLMDASDPSKLDMAKVTSFANAWYAAMEGVSLDLLEVQNDALKERSEHKRGEHGRNPRTTP